jgi:hypothetical protein
LCWSSKFSTLMRWSFALKLLVEAPKSLVNLCVEVLRWGSRLSTLVCSSLKVSSWVCWRASGWPSRCFESLHWNYASSIVSVLNLCVEASHQIVNVLKLYVDTPKSQLVILLGLLNFLLKSLGL